MPGLTRDGKPLPRWAAFLLGLLFMALGGFFLFAMIVGERNPSASLLALVAGGALALVGFIYGLIVLASALKQPRT